MMMVVMMVIMMMTMFVTIMIMGLDVLFLNPWRRPEAKGKCSGRWCLWRSNPGSPANLQCHSRRWIYSETAEIMSSSPEPMHVKDFNEIFMKMFPPICEVDIIPSQHPTHKTTNETLPDCPKRLAKLKSWTSPLLAMCNIFLGILLNIELKSFPKGSFSYIIIVSIIIILIMIILEEVWGGEI